MSRGVYTNLELLRAEKNSSQFFQRHLNVCRLGLVWSMIKCCCRCSVSPNTSEQPCHCESKTPLTSASSNRHAVRRDVAKKLESKIKCQ